MNELDAVTVDNLIKSFDSENAINKLSFSVKQNEMLVIVGPDGSGKTTLLRILAGIMSFDSGSARVFDYTIPDMISDARLKMGYMPQKFGLYEDLTVQENLDFFYSLYSLPKKDKQEIMERMYDFSQLKPFKNRLSGNLSGGMKQKLGLACVLLHKPPLLFLDEPTNGVDPFSRRTFWNILNEFKQLGITIVVATPFMDEAERGDRVLLMMDGKKLAHGTPEEIKGLWKGSLYEFFSRDSRKAKEILDSSSEVETSILFGDRIHFVPRDDNSVTKIKTELIQENLLLGNIEKIDPQLEDLFISLIKDEQHSS